MDHSFGNPFWRHFSIISDEFFVRFFRCAPRWSFVRCWCQTRSQTNAFGRRFHDFLGSGWTSENRALVWVLARFRGLEALPNRRIFRTFSCVLIGSHFKRHFVWFYWFYVNIWFDSFIIEFRQHILIICLRKKGQHLQLQIDWNWLKFDEINKNSLKLFEIDRNSSKLIEINWNS